MRVRSPGSPHVHRWLLRDRMPAGGWRGAVAAVVPQTHESLVHHPGVVSTAVLAGRCGRHH